MRMRFKQIFIILVVVVFVTVLACKPTHPQKGYFALALVKEINMLVCNKKEVTDGPCGNREVRFEAEGRTVYINVYGVVDKDEIRSLVDFAATFRGEKYKAIPIVMTFYIELREVNTLKALIGPKVVYKTTLKGGK